MKKVYILEEDDILKADDLVRNAIPSCRRSQYASEDIGDTDWKTVETSLPFWVGKKVGLFLKGVKQFHYQPNRYEFIRK